MVCIAGGSGGEESAIWRGRLAHPAHTYYYKKEG